MPCYHYLSWLYNFKITSEWTLNKVLNKKCEIVVQIKKSYVTITLKKYKNCLKNYNLLKYYIRVIITDKFYHFEFHFL